MVALPMKVAGMVALGKYPDDDSVDETVYQIPADCGCAGSPAGTLIT